MAGSGRRIFSPGEVLTASNTMNYLMDQAVMVFPDSGARGSAIGSAVSDGMVSYLTDTNSVEVYKTVGTAVAGWESNTVTQSPNVVINGGFEINQRGFTSTTTNEFGFDRWPVAGSGGTRTYTAQTFPVGTNLGGDEPTNFARLVTSGQSAAGDWASIYHRVEDVRTFASKTVTLSFWAKAASGTPNIGITFQQTFGSGGSSPVLTSAPVQAITTSWARYSFTVSIPSVSGKTIGANNYLQFYIFTSVGTTLAGQGYANVGIQNTTVDVWGVQLEVGSTATPFRRNANSIQGELAACQRYLEYGAGKTFAGSATYMVIAVNYRVTKRATPTLTTFTGTALAFTPTAIEDSTANYHIAARPGSPEVAYAWKAEAEL